MTKPFSEPNVQSDVATLAYRTRQLERRPGTVGGAFEILLFAPTERVVGGNGDPLLMIPRDLSGLRLIDCAAGVSFADTGDDVVVMIRNQSSAQDVLTTPITIDQGDRTSYFSVTQPVIDEVESEVTRGEWLAFDVDNDGTDATGLVVVLVFG